MTEVSKKDLLNTFVSLKQYIHMNINNVKNERDYSRAAHECHSHDDKNACKILKSLDEARNDLGKEIHKKERFFNQKVRDL